MGEAPASVRVDGYTIPVRVMGQGRPVVCSELPLNPFCRYAPVQERLAARHKVYVVDLRPVVDRTTLDGNENLLDRFSAVLMSTLDALDIESCALIGSFMFGGVAMNAAQQAPTRIEKLVLIGSLGMARLPRTWLMRGITGFYRLPGVPRFARFAAFRRTVEWGDRALLLKLRKRQLFYEPGRIAVSTEELYQHYARPPIDAAGWALMWCIRRLRYDTLLPHLDRVRCPTLILHGSHDIWVPPGHAMALKARLPAATLVWVPDARHMPELENTDFAVDAIDTFLDVPQIRVDAVGAPAL